MDKPGRHVVVDLETLSTRSNACIVSVGAVAIENYEIVDEFLVNVCAKTCEEAGLHKDQETIAWWERQSIEARQAWLKDPIPLTDALDKFALWYGNESIPIWGFGANFDVVILENAMTYSGWIDNRQRGNLFPWKFWDVSCLRTLMNVHGKRLIKTGVNHNALDDARSEAILLIELLRPEQSILNGRMV